MIHETADVDPTAVIGEGTKVWHQAQIREGARVGTNCVIGKGAYIGKDVVVGDNCKIQNYACLFRGVRIGNGVFVGPHTCFINDRHPRAVDSSGALMQSDQWVAVTTRVGDEVSIGANATILPGLIIWNDAVIGAGAVVTKEVHAGTTVVGNPAREVEE